MVTLSAKNSESTQSPSPATKPSSSSTPVMLTRSEIESLRRDKKESGAYFKKAFAKAMPKGG